MIGLYREKPLLRLLSWKTEFEFKLETSESVIGFYLLQAPIERPREAREENCGFVLEQKEGTQPYFLSAADRPAIWGTGYT